MLQTPINVIRIYINGRSNNNVYFTHVTVFVSNVKLFPVKYLLEIQSLKTNQLQGRHNMQ